MKALLLIAALAASAAAANAAEPCLRMNDVWSWHAPDSKTLIVETRWHNKFKLSLDGVCPAITQNKINLVLKSHTNSELACLERNDDVLVQSDIGPQRCLITKIVPYTAEMQKADEAAAKTDAPSQ